MKFPSSILLKNSWLYPGRYSPGYNLIIIIGGIAIAEAIAMVIVYFYRFLPYYQQVVMDATLMTVIIFPLLYFLSTRPLLLHIQQQIQTESVLQTRLRLVQYATTHTLEELLRAALDEIETLIGGTVSYLHLLEPDQQTLTRRACSTHTLQSMETVSSREAQHGLDRIAIWLECMQERQSVIRNNRTAWPTVEDTSCGYIPVTREMAIPIVRDESVAGILSVGNKPKNFTARDVELVSKLADFVWDIAKHKQAEDALRESEEKFRTLVDWTYDWEIWLDPDGKIVYSSPSCERITGYSPGEFIASPDLVLHIIHPEDKPCYQDHQQWVHDESAGIEKIEYRILSRDGSERWIEHICRPLFGADQHYLGRRVSNRDITERKQAEKDIRERNQKEKMLTQTIYTMQLDIARDLHDTIGQNISFLRMKLDHLAEKKIRKQAEMQFEIQSMWTAANESYDLMRGTLAILQSTNSTDLSRLFIRYAEQVAERSSFKIDFSSQGEPRSLAAKRMRQLFYIYREILSNIEKHAEASRVSIKMTWDQDLLTFEVCDNGKGFDSPKVPYGGHYGLRFMRERADLLNGSLTINSTVGSGTDLVLQLPYE